MLSRPEDFTRDPDWEGRGNRRKYVTTNVRPRFDFGFSPSQHAGGSARGELGGLVFRGDCRSADKLAAYGDRLAPLSLAKPLKASGKVSLRRGVSDSTTLLGFYHSHPDQPARPSQYDLDHAWPSFSYVIVSVMAGQDRALTSWRLRDDRSTFDEEMIEINELNR